MVSLEPTSIRHINIDDGLDADEDRKNNKTTAMESKKQSTQNTLETKKDARTFNFSQQNGIAGFNKGSKSIAHNKAHPKTLVPSQIDFSHNVLED